MFFYTFMPRLWNMSLTASVAILLVMALRIALRKAPRVFSYALWGIVLFRLLCPVSVDSGLSLFNLLDAPAQKSGSVTSVIEYVPADIVHRPDPAVRLPVSGVSDVINGALPRGEEQLAADPLEAPMAIAAYIWMAGVLAMVIYSVVSFIRLRRKLSVVVPLRENIYIADDIQSPFVMGLFRPAIYLPCGLSEKEQAYIILHEQHHIRRLDHIIKALAFLALTIHWFNPLVWAAFFLAGRDMETSCDEAVLRKVGGHIRADYAASLLTLATGRRIVAGTPLAFGEGDTKGRIRNLAKWHPPAPWVVLAAAAVCIALAVCLLTNPQAETRPAEGADPAAVQVWFDYYNDTAMPWADCLETGTPAFPDVTFRWYPGMLEAETGGETCSLYSGMPIWNAYFCDLTGDGLPDLCSTLSFGSGLIDDRVIIYDYANGVSYTLEDRGNFDYSLWLNEADGRLWVDQKVCGADTLAASGPLVYADGCIGIQHDEAAFLESAISQAILARYDGGTPDGQIHVESHVLLANEVIRGTQPADSAYQTQQITVYLLVLRQTYSTYGGTLAETGGSYVPAAITFRVGSFGEYLMEEYWEPRDGSGYADDIRQKFPGSAADDALNAQAYLEELQALCYKKALARMDRTGSIDACIGALLDAVQAFPAASSDPGEYIRAHQTEYQELLQYGEFTLRYCFTAFLQGGEIGLRGHIMAEACREIVKTLGEEPEPLDNVVLTGQDWFDGFYGNARVLAKNHGTEDLEKYYPASFLLLQMTGES